MKTSLEAGNIQNTETAKGKTMNLMRLLRISGVVILLVAAYQFIMRDVVGDNILGSYYAFLGFTVALAAGGWFCAKRWKDSAGGRTLLGLTAIFLPVHIVQHAAFIYARYEGLTDSTWYISYGELTLLMGVSIPLLIATTWLGYAGWLRKLSSTLAPLYIIMNLALLLPFRDPSIVALQGLIMAIPCIAIVGRLSKKHAILRSNEGIIARIAFIPPILILIGRNLMMDEWNAVFISLTTALLGSILYFTIPRELKSSGYRNLSRLFALIFFFVAWSMTLSHLDYFQVEYYDFPIHTLIISYLTVASLLLYINASDTKILRNLITVFLTITFTPTVIFNVHIWIGLISILYGLTISIIAYRNLEKFTLYNGLILFLTGIVFYIIHVIAEVDSVSWVSMAILGLLISIAASFLEGRKFTWHQLKARTQETFEGWN